MKKIYTITEGGAAFNNQHFYIKTDTGSILYKATEPPEMHNIEIDANNLQDLIETVDKSGIQNDPKNKIYNEVREKFLKNSEETLKDTFYSSRNAFNNTNTSLMKIKTVISSKNLTIMDKYVLSLHDLYKIESDTIDFQKIGTMSEGNINKVLDDLQNKFTM